MGEAPNLPTPPVGLDWVKLRQELDHVDQNEPTVQKILRKIQENPLVPIGAIATVGALTYGLLNFVRGNREMQQKMMRARIGAQLFTVLAAVGGIMFSLPKEKRSLIGLIEHGDSNNQE